MNSKNLDMSTWVFGGVLVLVGIFLLIGLGIVNSQADDVPTSGDVGNADPAMGAQTLSLSSYGADIAGDMSPDPSTTSGVQLNTPHYFYGVASDTNGCEDLTNAATISGVLCGLGFGITIIGFGIKKPEKI